MNEEREGWEEGGEGGGREGTEGGEKEEMERGKEGTRAMEESPSEEGGWEKGSG